ncbi:universal stress protein [Azohydromonas lata]|uniref:Universal stress protein n=1 Tax=Azohydromonas lata TaxID=45677 RepID=A0ABU5ICC7_9BURK|nr:universal stress protein [Azohydromonas lata]MDZ5456778.1 universal stress protein [Azohydromonas lata]
MHLIRRWTAPTRRIAMYSRILVPLDGSDTAASGLREALALARDLHATLVLLHVVNEFPMLVEMASVSSIADIHEGLIKRGNELLAKASRDATAAGVPCETLLHEMASGRVGDVIAEQARVRDCRLIVMGTHGRRGVSRLVMGSDAEITVRCAPVPVLLVRQQDTSA